MKISELIDIKSRAVDFWEDVYNKYKDIDLSTVDILDIVDYLNERVEFHFPDIDVGFKHFREINSRIYLMNLDYHNLDNLVYLWFLGREKIDFGIKISLIEENTINQYKLDYADSYNIQFKLSENKSLIDLEFFSENISEDRFDIAFVIIRFVLGEWSMYSKLNSIRMLGHMPENPISLSELYDKFTDMWINELGHSGKNEGYHFNRHVLPALSGEEVGIMNGFIPMRNKLANHLVGSFDYPFSIFMFVAIKSEYDSDELDEFESLLFDIYEQGEGIITVITRQPSENRYSVYGYCANPALIYLCLESLLKKYPNFNAEIKVLFDQNWYVYRYWVLDQNVSMDLSALDEMMASAIQNHDEQSANNQPKKSFFQRLFKR